MNEKPLNQDLLPVLVAEDDEGLRRLICRRLKRNQFTVLEAGSGEEAIKKGAESTEEILLLLDFRLQDLTGREVLDRLKEKGVEFPFIIMTGHGDERIAVEMMKLGARDYLVKDKSFLDILPGVMEQVQNRLYTERKLAGMEEALRESEYRFRMLFNSGTDAIMVHEIQDGKDLPFVEANDISCKRLGYTREGIKEIKKAGERAASLTQQLLAFSRKQMLKPKLLDLNNVVLGIEKMLKRIIGENITFISEMEPGIMQIKADPGQVEQIILNLAVNADDAMQKGGELTIKTENKYIDDHYCSLIPDSRPGQFVGLSITDTGEGMPRDLLQHIFEPFFTTKKVGTGLGLSVVYGIIKQHNGWINVYSEPGKGTTFNIYFPAVIDEAQTVTEEGVSLKDLHGNKEKILFVEDEEGVRNITIRALRDYGYDVTEAVTVQDAIERFNKMKGNVALVFSDIVLPDRTGIELVEELTQLKPGLKVLLTSGYADQKSRWSDVNEKGLPFLQKPYSLADLLKTIREVLG